MEEGRWLNSAVKVTVRCAARIKDFLIGMGHLALRRIVTQLAIEGMLHLLKSDTSMVGYRL